MHIDITFNLVDKVFEIDGEKKAVYYLEVFHVVPDRMGLGCIMSNWVMNRAKQDGKDCVVGLAMPDTYNGFYKKCGWFSPGMHDEHMIITSKPVRSIHFE
jgi:hypothetical protein